MEDGLRSSCTLGGLTLEFLMTKRICKELKLRPYWRPHQPHFFQQYIIERTKSLQQSAISLVTAGVAQSVERNSHFSSSINNIIANSETGVALNKEYYLKVAGSSPAFGSSPMNIIISFFCRFFYFCWRGTSVFACKYSMPFVCKL